MTIPHPLTFVELGQYAFGNPWGDYPGPQLVDALVREILSEIDRVFWNKNQRHWDKREDPGIPGIEFRPYYWGDDEAIAALPNLKHGDVEVLHEALKKLEDL